MFFYNVAQFFIYVLFSKLYLYVGHLGNIFVGGVDYYYPSKYKIKESFIVLIFPYKGMLGVNVIL